MFYLFDRHHIMPDDFYKMSPGARVIAHGFLAYDLEMKRGE